MYSDQNMLRGVARSTSGAVLDLHYDRATNSIVYVDSGSTGMGREAQTPRAVFRQPLKPSEVVRLRRPVGP